MAVQKQDDQHEHTFSNYVRIRDVVQKTCLRRWMIEGQVREGQGYPCYRHNMMMMMIYLLIVRKNQIPKDKNLMHSKSNIIYFIVFLFEGKKSEII